MKRSKSNPTPTRVTQFWADSFCLRSLPDQTKQAVRRLIEDTVDGRLKWIPTGVSQVTYHNTNKGVAYTVVYEDKGSPAEDLVRLYIYDTDFSDGYIEWAENPHGILCELWALATEESQIDTEQYSKGILPLDKRI